MSFWAAVILADAGVHPSDPTSYQSMGWLMVCVVALIAGINQVLRLLDRFKERPRPADTYVTKEEHKERVVEFRSQLAEIRQAREQDTRAVRGDIDDMREQFGEDLRGVHQRIDDLPNSIITTLKQTGVIK